MKIPIAAMCVLACQFAGFSTIRGQDEAPDEATKAATEQTETYVAAFNKADIKALAALYAEDAEYTSSDGTTIQGREALAEGLKKFFASNKGAVLAVEIESARFLTPEVLLEKGTAHVAGQSTKYRCNYIKKDGAWLIAELEESPMATGDAAARALAELAPLVGTWKDNSPGVAVETRVSFTLNERFLRRSFSVKREGTDPIEGTEVIGYDPVAGQIRSWVFDSEGGFGEGFWTQEGNKWMITASATAPDGTLSSAQHTITLIDTNKLTWESSNRVADGQALPNLDKVEVVRAANP